MKTKTDHFFSALWRTLSHRTSPAEKPHPVEKETGLTQKEAILAHLFHGQELSVEEAIERYGCFRLSARIWELKAEGYPIVSRRIRNPDGKCVAAYRLETENMQ